LWYTEAVNGTKKSYEERMHNVGTFGTVAEMWSYVAYLKPPTVSGSDYHVFREHIVPMWEAPENKNGGKFVIRVRKSETHRAWLNVLLLVLGPLAMDEVCGVVVSVRHGEDSICVWHREVQNKGMVAAKLKTLLFKDGASGELEYKAHDTSLANVKRTQE
jgi:translation initiation factor 4E